MRKPIRYYVSSGKTYYSQPYQPIFPDFMVRLHGANVLFSTIGFDSSPKRMTNKMLMLDMPLGQTTVPGWPLSGPQHVAGREEGSVKPGSIIELMIRCIFARCEKWVLVLNYPTIMGLS